MVGLTELPPEILHDILMHMKPWDLYALKLVSRYMNSYITGNKVLCRDVYSQMLDQPTNIPLDWEQQIKDLLWFVAVGSLSDREPKETIHPIFASLHDRIPPRTHLPIALRAITNLLSNISSTTTTTLPHPDPDPGSQPRPKQFCPTYHRPSTIDFLSEHLFQKSAPELLLRQSFIFHRAIWSSRTPPSPSPDPKQQMSAKISCLVSQPLSRWESTRLYPFACAKVYDLREYTDDSLWGPFYSDMTAADGVALKVDWEKVQAILIVLGHNIEFKGANSGYPHFPNVWARSFPGTWAGSYLPFVMGEPEDEGEKELYGTEKEESDERKRKQKELDERDVYGVSGLWLRVVCFLDYNDFFAFNFPPRDQLPDDQPRPALSCGEATRVILMSIRAVRTGQDENGPVTWFKGTSRPLGSVGDDDSDLRGQVRMTAEGEVRWTSYSVFQGEERWKSEGVQIGGRRSARGVVGNWFERDMDPHGPAGPTSFWKVADFGDVDLEREGVTDEYLGRLQDQVLEGMSMDHNSEMDEDFVDEEDEEEEEGEEDEEEEDEDDYEDLNSFDEDPESLYYVLTNPDD